MPLNNRSKILLSILFVLFTVYGFSQTNNRTNRNWQFNYNVGFSQFYGDASNNGYFKKLSGEIAFATGFSVRKYVSPAFGIGFDFLYSGLKSIKDKRATGAVANYELTGSYYDGSLNLLVDFNSLFWGENKNRFSVYGKIGIGYGSWNTELNDLLSGGIISSGSTIGTTTFKSGAFVMPAGLGMNYMISDSWSLNFEMNLRTVLNDDVDVWRDGFKYDQPLYTSFGVSYYIFSKSRKRPKPTKQMSKPASSGKPIDRPIAPYNYRVQPESTKPVDPGTPVMPISKQQINNNIIYRVQILAKRQNLPSIYELKSRYNISGDIYENVQNGLHRYSVGEFSTYRDAVTHSNLLRNRGVHDAFVVAYQNNNRIVITSEMKKH